MKILRFKILKKLACNYEANVKLITLYVYLITLTITFLYFNNNYSITFSYLQNVINYIANVTDLHKYNCFIIG